MPDFPATPPTCEGCGACVNTCPMGCCEGDRSNCLSALTQKKGAISPKEAASIREGGLLWGCDACQLSCPHNIRVVREGRDTVIPYFKEERLVRLDAQTLTAMTDEAFSARAYSWRGRSVISRNIALLEENKQAQVHDHSVERSSST